MTALRKRPVYLVIKELDFEVVGADGELETAKIIYGLRQSRGSADRLKEKLEEDGQEGVEVVKMFIVSE